MTHGSATPAPSLDIAANRKSRKWSLRARLGRVLWGLAHPLFAYSPRLCWGWRAMLLRGFGARIGRDVQIFPSVRVTIPWNLAIGDETAVGDRAILYALGPIRIGRQVTISQNAHLCAGSHDYEGPDMALLKPPIVIGDASWICADAFVGPGVTIARRCVVGARAVVVKDVASDLIVAGNPARPIRKRSGGL